MLADTLPRVVLGSYFPISLVDAVSDLGAFYLPFVVLSLPKAFVLTAQDVPFVFVLPVLFTIFPHPFFLNLAFVILNSLALLLAILRSFVRSQSFPFKTEKHCGYAGQTRQVHPYRTHSFSWV